MNHFLGLIHLHKMIDNLEFHTLYFALHFSYKVQSATEAPTHTNCEFNNLVW